MRRRAARTTSLSNKPISVITRPAADGLPLAAQWQQRPKQSHKVLLSFFILSAVPLWAKGPGTTSANFLKITLGARAAALGGAYAALADDVNAIGHNPAGLARLQTQEAGFTYNRHFEGVNQGWLAWGLPLKWGTIGAGLNYLSVDAFNAYDVNDQPAGSVSASDLALSLPYANSLTVGAAAKLSLGANLKYIAETLNDQKAGAFAFDGGAILEPQGVAGLSLAMAFENLGGKMTFVNESFPLPFNVKLGAGYQMEVAQNPNHALAFSLEGHKPNDNDFFVLGGAEYRFWRVGVVRLGYRSLDAAGSGLAFGLGYQLNPGGGAGAFSGLSVDYAFVDAGDLSSTHRVSLAFRFGASKMGGAAREKEMRQTRDAKKEPAKREEKALSTEREKELRDRLEKELQKTREKLKK